MSVTAVLCTHNNPIGAWAMYRQLVSQTLVPEEIIILASDTGDELWHLESLPTVTVRHVPNYEDFGQVKRAMGLMMARGEYVGFFNDDDEYEPEYIETMYKTAKANDADIVLNDWYEKDRAGLLVQTYPTIGLCTAGNFLVSSTFGQGIGWNDRDYCADGRFVERCMEGGAKWIRVSTPLYRHK